MSIIKEKIVWHSSEKEVGLAVCGWAGVCCVNCRPVWGAHSGLGNGARGRAPQVLQWADVCAWKGRMNVSEQK